MEKQLLESQELVKKESKKEDQKHKSTFQIVQSALIASMGSFLFGYEMAELNMAQPTLNYEYQIQPDQEKLYQGILTSSVVLGAVFGCLLAGQILQKWGRRQIFIICDIITILACIFLVIKQFFLAVALRFIIGIVVGINSTVVPLYLREISPIQISGIIGVIYQGCLNVGVVVGYLLGLGFPIEDEDIPNQGQFYWRFVLTFPIITSIIRILGLFFISNYDTPQYYLLQNQEDKAIQVISLLYKEQYKDEIIHQFLIDQQEKEKNKDTWKVVFSKNYKSRLIIGCFVSFFQQVSGINAIVFYSENIFESCLGEKRISNYMTVVCGSILMIFSFLSGVLTKVLGRRQILMYGALILSLILSGTGVVSYLSKDQVEIGQVSDLVTVSIISLIFLYLIVFALSLGPLTWVYNADIINSEKALGLATSLNQFFAFLIGLVFPIGVEQLGIYTTFFLFAGFCVLAFLFYYFCLIETKGLTQKEIISVFQKKGDTDQKSFNSSSEYEETSFFE